MQYRVKTISQLGTALKSMRISAGLTQNEVSEKVGLLQKTISALESGAPRSSIGSLIKLLAALECDIILSPVKDRKSGKDMEW